MLRPLPRAGPSIRVDLWADDGVNDSRNVTPMDERVDTANFGLSQRGASERDGAPAATLQPQFASDIALAANEAPVRDKPAPA